MKTKTLLLPAPPTPYEYALLSQLAYHDNLASLPPLISEAYQWLLAKGWCREIKSEKDSHHASIWVNSKTQQVVIAHRGSQNIDSWLTDLESVVQSRPGSFTHAAVNLLNHPSILEYRKQGYRLSTTGHSLGGFLAQVCVFWSQRHELEDSYYSDMSAVVFDSPGAVDFLEVLSSNLASEKGSINISQLNIQNFCILPTVVNTYGTHTGTIWQLGETKEISFSFIMGHTLGNILPGFDAQTGYPKQFRQMLDWPQADYRPYQSFASAIEHVKSQALKLPFRCLNALYKRYIKRAPTDTWFDKVLGDETLVDFLQSNVNLNPTEEALQDVEKRLNLAIKNHYSTYSHESISARRLNLVHFDQQVQVFLNDLIMGRKENIGALNWGEALRAHYQEDSALLCQFTIDTPGDKQVVTLTEAYKGTIFDFQRDLLRLLAEKGVPSFYIHLGEVYDELNQQLQRVGNQEEVKRLKAQLEQIQAAQREASRSELIVRTATAEVPGTQALRLLGANDYKQMNTEEILKLCQGIKPGTSVFVDSARAMAQDCKGTVVSPDVDKELASIFANANISQPPQTGFLRQFDSTRPAAPFSLQPEGVNWAQVKEGVFRVSLDYVVLRLSGEQRKSIQSLLIGCDGTDSFDYIENSSITKKDCIIQLDFDSQPAAQRLVQQIKQNVAQLLSSVPNKRSPPSPK